MTGSLQGFTKRGFVMTGGGAKGLYEAGVVHAFHLCGMEFDVITGSSIGAMNAIFFAEYLFRKRHLPSEIRKDPERALEEMDNLIKAYHGRGCDYLISRLLMTVSRGRLVDSRMICSNATLTCRQ